MPSNRRVIFILGGGPRVGHGVTRSFLQEGYKVALGRRSTPSDTANTGIAAIQVDVSSSESVAKAFQEVESSLGIPNIVVYNAAALTVPKPNDPFSVPPDQYNADLAVNASGAYAALHYATRGFQALRHNEANFGAENLPTVFIATGNVTPFYPHPVATTLGSGKAALTYLIALGDQEYKNSGNRLYFVSEVTDEGGPVANSDLHGDAHGEVYWRTVQGNFGANGWDLRFVVDSNGEIQEKNV